MFAAVAADRTGNLQAGAPAFRGAVTLPVAGDSSFPALRVSSLCKSAELSQYRGNGVFNAAAKDGLRWGGVGDEDFNHTCAVPLPLAAIAELACCVCHWCA